MVSYNDQSLERQPASNAIAVLVAKVIRASNGSKVVFDLVPFVLQAGNVSIAAPS